MGPATERFYMESLESDEHQALLDEVSYRGLSAGCPSGIRRFCSLRNGNGSRWRTFRTMRGTWTLRPVRFVSSTRTSSCECDPLSRTLKTPGLVGALCAHLCLRGRKSCASWVPKPRKKDEYALARGMHS
jgi:hypothetical protein